MLAACDRCNYSDKGCSKELVLMSGGVTTSKAADPQRGKDLPDDSKLGIVFPHLTLSVLRAQEITGDYNVFFTLVRVVKSPW